ncbi:MAG: N-methylhydantoinase [Pseudonocardiales bacterium]|nr:N-methylhydantoinase [Pseudonocardiales bacterium]
MTGEVRYTIGIDIGGTFTDLTMVTEQGITQSTKAPTTPDDFSIGVMDALAEAAGINGITLDQLVRRTDVLKNGSTVATNALLTREGTRVGLITTRGFEDTVFIMRAVGRVDGLPAEEVRRIAYVDKPQPLLPRDRVMGVHERIDCQGRVVVPVNIEDIAAAMERLVEIEGVESIAVSFLHAWRNPDHEHVVRRMIDERYGDRNIFVSLSSDLSREAGEYARTNTAVANAFVGPAVHRYLGRLSERLSLLGFSGRLLVMQGNGGLASIDHAAPISTLQSGPAGGMFGAALMSEAMGHRVVVTADMGGTSFDVGILSDGVWKYADEPIFARLRMLQPIIDIRSIGAGGGTIARIDPITTRMSVGPQSAGAQPGPACYDAGGTEPTVTDCNLVLGYLDPDFFLGGRKSLSVERAEQAIRANLAEPLGLSVLESAAGVFDIINSKMSDLIRREVVRNGEVPAECVLYAFGGAGAIHATSWARELGMSRIVIANTSPVFSAHGIAMSDFLRTRLATLTYVAPFDPAQLNRDLDTLEDDLAMELAKDGFNGTPAFKRYVTMHFLRQTTGEEMPLPWDRFDGKAARGVEDLYVEHYRRLYGAGAAYEKSGLAMSRIRVDAVGAIDRRAAEQSSVPTILDEARHGSRRAYFDGDLLDTVVYRKDRVPAGSTIAGPAILESELTTIVVAPGTSAEIDALGNVGVTV